MGKPLIKARAAAAVLGIGALLAAATLPGAATAADQGEATARVTRAVLMQGDAAADISRSTLITQIQVDGQGDVTVTVPVAEGSTPKSMDSFGRPTVEGDAAVYELAVDGPDTIRSSQSFDGDLPVRVTVTATLDGQSINPTDLAGKTGVVELTYTAENLTVQTEELTFTGADGEPVTQTAEVPTAMGGTLDITFPPTWTEITSQDATTITGDGAGSVLFSAGFTLFEPFGDLEQSVVIQGRMTDGEVPPAVLKFAVLQPQQNPTARSLTETLEGATESGTAIYEGGVTLEDGLTQLQDGLVTASDGAAQIAEGVSTTLVPGVNTLNSGVQGELAPGVAELNAGVQDTLAPGVNQLNDGIQTSLVPGVDELLAGLADLPDTVTDSAEFEAVTDGFASLNGAVDGVREKLGKFITDSADGPGQFLLANGDVDTDRTDVARTLWALIYGVRSIDVPASSPTSTPNEDTGGLTNPKCQASAPTDPKNPCGAWQIVKGVSGALTGPLTAGVDSLTAGVAGLTAGTDALITGINTQIRPGIQQVQGGLVAASDQLTSTTPGTGGAWVVGAIAQTLGCTVAVPPGFTGPVVTGCPKSISVDGGPDVSANVFPLLQGLSGSIYKPGDPANPANSGLAALLDIFAAGLGQVDTGLGTTVIGGLNQIKGGLGQINTGLAQIKGGLGQSAFGLNELAKVITTDPTGNPDPDTSGGKNKTATGILNELRRSLANGGAGDTGVAGRCEGYNTPGKPGSGLNEDATESQISRTCAAGDVLNLALLISDKLETGISTTLLEGISDTLVESVSPLQDGVAQLADGSQQIADGINDTLAPGTQQLADGVVALADGTQQLADGVVPLADGTQQLAEGLPAAVDGTERLITEGAQALQESGGSTANDYAAQVALVGAMNDQARVDAWIPGGAPTGTNVSANGVYVFELAGTGSSTGASTGTNFALGALALAAAAVVGGFAASRRRSAAA